MNKHNYQDGSCHGTNSPLPFPKFQGLMSKVSDKNQISFEVTRLGFW